MGLPLWRGRGKLSQGAKASAFSVNLRASPDKRESETPERVAGQVGEGGGFSAPAAVGRVPRPMAGAAGRPCGLVTASGHSTEKDPRRQAGEGPAPQPAWGTPLVAPSPAPAGGAHLKLQEGDVEEPVQVLEAEAVLHGGLSVAEVRGSRGPVHRRAESESLRRPGQRGALGRGCTRARLSWEQCPGALGWPVGNGPTVPGGDVEVQVALLGRASSGGRPDQAAGAVCPCRASLCTHPCWPRDGPTFPPHTGGARP